MHMNKSRQPARAGRIIGVAATVALAATTALAQEAPENAPGTTQEGPEAQLEDAQARLEAAAREIAALTAEIMGDVGMSAIARLEELARQPRPVMLGITIGPEGAPDAREAGVRVLGVTPGSSADEAGIRSGDVLLSLGATQLDWSDDTSPVSKLLDGLAQAEPGSQLELGYRRDGSTTSVQVEARPWSWSRAYAYNGERTRVAPPPGTPHPRAFIRQFMADRWGDMELVALTPGLGDYFEASEGVLVVRAPADDTLGLEDGDVIVDIAGRAPLDPGHVARILRSYAPGERLVMTVVRHGERVQLEADIPGEAERS